MAMVMEYSLPTINDYKDRSGDITFFNMVNCNPKFVLRFLSLLFSVVVFGCMSATGVDPDTKKCIFNANPGACHYGVAIPLIAFIACLLFVGVDLKFNNIWSDVVRRYLVGCEFFFSSLWAFMWFVGFCFLADEWRRSSIKSTSQSNNARAAIAFSFFSVFTWAGLSLLAWTRYQHIGSLQLSYETLPDQSDYSVEYSRDTSKYSIFPEVRGGRDAPFLYDEGPQYVVPRPPQGTVVGISRPAPGR